MFNSDLISTLVAAVGGGLVTAGALAAWLGSVWKDRITRAEMGYRTHRCGFENEANRGFIYRLRTRTLPNF